MSTEGNSVKCPCMPTDTITNVEDFNQCVKQHDAAKCTEEELRRICDNMVFAKLDPQIRSRCQELYVHKD